MDLCVRHASAPYNKYFCAIILVMWSIAAIGFISAFFVSLLLAPWAVYVAKRIDAIGYPTSILLARKKNLRQELVTKPRLEKPPTPLLGGAAYVISFVVVVAVGLALSSVINFPRESVNSYILWFLGVVVLLTLGVLDDKFELPGLLQFLAHVLAVLLFMLSGFDITVINLPFFGSINLNWWSVRISNWISFVFPGDILAGFLIFLMLYGLKFQSGTDGLMEGYTAIALLVNAALAFSLGNTVAGFMSAVLSGALFGFLVFSFPLAAIRSGSAGKSVIGYLVATLTIIAEGKFTVLLGVFALPVLDALTVLLRRFLKYKSIKKMFVISDRTHFHYRLMDLGLSEAQIAYFEYAYAMIVGIILVFAPKHWRSTIVVLVWIFTLFLIYIINKKSYEKVLAKTKAR